MDSTIKDKIIFAASVQFFKYGYSAISMDSISDSLGMSKKTLYTIFTSKYDLLIHVVNQFKLNLSSDVELILNNEEVDFNTKLKNMMLCIGNALSRISPEFFVDLRVNLPEMWDSLRQYKKDAAYVRFNRLITQGQNEGYIKKEINKSVAVAMYAVVIESLFDKLFMTQLPDDISSSIPENPSELYESIISILFNGIMANRDKTIKTNLNALDIKMSYK